LNAELGLLAYWLDLEHVKHLGRVL
jgi:hypothetical protein